MKDEQSESLEARYARLAQESPRRSRDLVLRLLDVALSTLFLLVALPFAVVVSLAILFTTGRPILSAAGCARRSWTRSRSSGTSCAAT
jgi:lipopolysaccharide/colanic/teichoic acid biosynthesis glycosyltransferase